MSAVTAPAAVYGHEDVLAALSPLPAPVVALVGPEGIGKATLARYVAHAMAEDVEEFPRLDTEAAKRVIALNLFRPMGTRVIIVDLDEATAYHRLLALWERPLQDTFFILVASRELPPTVASRAMRFNVGLLPESQVEIICREVMGLGPGAAAAAAHASGGRVSQAMRYHHAAQTRASVETLLGAIGHGDADLLAHATSGVGAEEFLWLQVWAREARTEQWAAFDPEESGGCQKDERLIAALLSMPMGRPRLAVRAATWLACERRAGRA